MNWKIELIMIPVSDIDRSKMFYVEQLGFSVDHDIVVHDDLRFVQLTPPGSACSIAIGLGITDAVPGSVEGIQVVVEDVQAEYAKLIGRGVKATPVEELSWGRFVYFSDPDGNRWALQELPFISENADHREAVSEVGFELI